MLRRLAALLALSLLAWGGLALWQRGTADTPAGLALPPLSEELVDRIRFQRGADTVVLTRAGSAWRVNGVPADAAIVARFLAAGSDSSLASELISQSTVSHQRLGLDSAAALHLEVTGAGQERLRLLVGNRGPDFEGFYVRRSGEAAAYLLRGDLVEATTRSMDDWRDRRILALPAGGIGRVEVRRGKERYQVESGGSGWTVGGVPGDSAAVARYLSLFGDLRASGFPDPAELGAIRFEAADLEVVVRDPGGKELAGLVLVPAEGGFWVRTRDGVVYRMDSAAGGRIAPPIENLRPPR